MAIKLFTLISLLSILGLSACSKKSPSSPNTDPNPNPNPTPVDTVPIDTSTSPDGLVPLDSHVVLPADSGFLLAKSYYDLGIYDMAAFMFDSLISDTTSQTDLAAAYLYSGNSHLNLDQFDTAVTRFDVIINTYSTSEYLSYAIYGKGFSTYKLAAADTTLLDSAKSIFTSLLNQFPNSPNSSGAIFYLGKIGFDTQDWMGCVERYDLYLKDYLNTVLSDNALYYRGRCHFELQEYAYTRSDVDKLISQYPASGFYANAHYWDGRANLMLGLADTTLANSYHQSAIQFFDQYLALDSNGMYNSEAILFSGEASFFMNDWANARTKLMEIETKFPGSPDIAPALYYLGRTEMGDLKYSVAIDYFRRILNEFPNSQRIDDAQFQIGKSFYRMGEPVEGSFTPQSLPLLDSAAVQLKIVLSNYPNSVKNDNTLLYLVRTYADYPLCTEAKNYLSQMTQQFPNSILLPYAQNHSGLVHNCP